MPIDMWSFGCILAELYTGYPLFPGENEVEQLACIMEILGLPPNLVLEQATRRRLFFGKIVFNPDCKIVFNRIALRTAKTLWSFGHSECNRIK